MVAGIATCADVDGDGDIEFPEGTYEAGAILDNDVVYNTRDLRFTSEREDSDTDRGSVDLMAIATHELGHSQGLSHSLVNQHGPGDASGATMFPSVDTGDPQDELSQRVPDSEAVALVSALYPEGSAAQGPAALQPGDQAVSATLGRIRGRVLDPAGNPVLFASVFCRERARQQIVNSVFSGRARGGRDASLKNGIALSRSEAVVDGDFEMLLPPGIYECGIEAADGKPVSVPGLRLNEGASAAEAAGLTRFPEEFFNGPAESALEREPGAALPLQVVAGGVVEGVNFVTNREGSLSPVDLQQEGVPAALPGGVVLTVAIPGAALLELEQRAQAALGSGASLAIPSISFGTSVADASTLPRFAGASLDSCERSVDPTTGAARLRIGPPLRAQSSFVGQAGDQSPLYLEDPVGLGRQLLRQLRAAVEPAIDPAADPASRPLKDVCVSLQAQGLQSFPGPSGTPPQVLLTNVDAGLGFTFVGNGSGAFQPLPSDGLFSLEVVALPPTEPTLPARID